MIVNSSTSQGELRKNCVTNQEPLRTGSNSEICMSPSATPAIVPNSIAKKEIMRLSANPFSVPSCPHRMNGIHLISASMGLMSSLGACACAVPMVSTNISSIHMAWCG